MKRLVVRNILFPCCFKLSSIHFSRNLRTSIFISRSSKLIWRPVIFHEENEEYEWNRYREIWEHNFPSEPFENEAETEFEISFICLYVVKICRIKCWSKLFRRCMVYLVARKQLYKTFLFGPYIYIHICWMFLLSSYSRK